MYFIHDPSLYGGEAVQVSGYDRSGASSGNKLGSRKVWLRTSLKANSAI